MAVLRDPRQHPGSHRAGAERSATGARPTTESQSSTRKMSGQPGRTPPGAATDVTVSELTVDPLGFLRGMVEEFGNVTRHHTDGRPVTIVNEPDLVNEILVTRRSDYAKTGT